MFSLRYLNTFAQDTNVYLLSTNAACLLGIIVTEGKLQFTGSNSASRLRANYSANVDHRRNNPSFWVVYPNATTQNEITQRKT